MTVVDLRYSPGTVAEPQHTKSSQVAFIDTDHVFFREGKASRIPFYQATSYTDNAYGFDGTCRSQWTTQLGGEEGRYDLLGCHERLYCLHRGVLTNITPLKTVKEATLAADPLSTTSGSPDVDVTYTAHGLAEGDRIKLTGATATGGITTGQLNIEHIVQGIVDADTFTITVSGNASSTATGGGAAIDIFYQITAGNEAQSLGVGYGAGLYGSGVYGAYRTSSGAQVFPRIWSFDNYGNEVVMCPGDYEAGDGQKIYRWDGDTTVAPAVLTNAPTDCIGVMVINNRVVAFRERNISIADLVDPTIWSGDTFNSIDVQRCWKIMARQKFGQKQAVIFTPEPSLLTVDGADADLEELNGAPITAPMASCRYRDAVVWYGEDGNFHWFDGAGVKVIENTQCGEDVRRNVNYGKSFHIFMHADPLHDQCWLYYPRGSASDCSDYVIWKNGQGGDSFTKGVMQRNSAQRPEMIERSFLMTGGDGVFSHFLKSSTKTLSWYARTSFFFAGDGSARMELNDIWPDIYMAGDVTLTVYGKEYPQDEETNWGSYTLTSSMRNMTIKGAGKLISLKFSGDYDFTLAGAKLDLELTGAAF